MANSADLPTTGVLAWYQTSPQIFLWGNPDWDFQSVHEIGESGETVLAFDGATYLDVFVGQGLLNETRSTRRTRAAPHGSSPPTATSSSRASSPPSPTSSSTRRPEWNRPVKFLLVSNEYPVYQNSIAVRSDRLESDGDCLAALVPLLQQAAVDYIADPQPINDLLVDYVSRIDGGGFTLSDGLVADATAKQIEYGIVANGTDGVFGSFDDARVQTIIDVAHAGADRRRHAARRRAGARRPVHQRLPRPVDLVAMTADSTEPERVAASPDAWIATVPWSEATGVLRDAYDWQAAKLGEPTEFTQLGSLAPELVMLRLELYRTVEAVDSNLTVEEKRLAAYVTSIVNSTPHCSSGLELQLHRLGIDPEVIARAAATPEALASGNDSLGRDRRPRQRAGPAPVGDRARAHRRLRSRRTRRSRRARPQQHRRLLRLHQPVATGLGLVSTIPAEHAFGAAPE